VISDRISSRLAEHALGLAIVAGLLGIFGVVLGSGIAGYPTLAEDEGAYLEQVWALNLSAVSHWTPWRDHTPLGWVPMWFMGNLAGALVSGRSALAQGRITMLVPVLLGAAVLFVVARGGGHDRAQHRLDREASLVMLRFEGLRSREIGRPASAGPGEISKCISEVVSLSAATSSAATALTS
jgi:hypothetical protein